MPGQRYHIAVRRHFDPHLPGRNASPPRPFPLLLLTVFVRSLPLGCDIGGRLVRRIPPLLFCELQNSAWTCALTSYRPSTSRATCAASSANPALSAYKKIRVLFEVTAT
jgi:hypothetical protein